MRFAVRTSTFSLSTRTRMLIERYLRLALGRGSFPVSAVRLYLRRAGDYGIDSALVARLVVRSPQFRQITIRDVDRNLARLLMRIVRHAWHVGQTRHERKIQLGQQFDNRFSQAIPYAATLHTPTRFMATTTANLTIAAGNASS